MAETMWFDPLCSVLSYSLTGINPHSIWVGFYANCMHKMPDLNIGFLIICAVSFSTCLHTFMHMYIVDGHYLTGACKLLPRHSFTPSQLMAQSVT